MQYYAAGNLQAGITSKKLYVIAVDVISVLTRKVPCPIVKAIFFCTYTLKYKVLFN